MGVSATSAAKFAGVDLTAERLRRFDRVDGSGLAATTCSSAVGADSWESVVADSETGSAITSLGGATCLSRLFLPEDAGNGVSGGATAASARGVIASALGNSCSSGAGFGFRRVRGFWAAGSTVVSGSVGSDAAAVPAARERVLRFGAAGGASWPDGSCAVFEATSSLSRGGVEPGGSSS